RDPRGRIGHVRATPPGTLRRRGKANRAGAIGGGLSLCPPEKPCANRWRDASRKGDRQIILSFDDDITLYLWPPGPQLSGEGRNEMERSPRPPAPTARTSRPADA